MQPVQVKMARAALELSPDALAREAGVEESALRALEAGETVAGSVTSALNLYLATHGIELIDGDGIRARVTAAKDFVPIDAVTTDTDGGIS